MNNGYTLKADILERSQSVFYGQLFKECPQCLAQQSLQWADVISPISPDRPYFLVVREESNKGVLGGLPLYYFEAKLGGILTSVPHAGPLGGGFYRGDMDLNLRRLVYSTLLSSAIQLAKKMKCISLTIITNPFTDDAALYKESSTPNYIMNNFCQAIDLSFTLKNEGAYETGKSSYNNHLRKNLAKAEKAGVVVSWGDDADFEPWYEIHCKRHKELGVTPLPESLLRGILSVMKPAGMGGLAVAKIDKRVVGGCFYIWHRDVADAFIMSSDSDCFDCGVNYAVTYFAVRYFRKRGVKWFNWQSCKKNSGVYLFKKRWGSREFPYQFLTWTYPGFEEVFKVEVEDTIKWYQWHYIAPFEAIRKKITNGVFDKGCMT